MLPDNGGLMIWPYNLYQAVITIQRQHPVSLLSYLQCIHLSFWCVMVEVGFLSVFINYFICLVCYILYKKV